MGLAIPRLLYFGCLVIASRGGAEYFGGDKAVDVFIILSGFVISLLLLREREPYQTFICRRFFRLYPVFIVCLVGATIFQIAGWMPSQIPSDQVGPHLLLNLLMLQSAVPDWLLPGASTSILGPAWSVSLEWQFYLLAPPIIFAMGFGIRGFIIVSLVCVLVFRGIGPMGWGLLSKLHLFWVGIASALLFHWIDGEVGKLRIGFAACLTSLSAALLLLPYRPYVGLFIWLVVFGAIMAARSNSANARQAMGILRSGPILTLGLLSYAIYLAHWPWLWLCQSLFGAELNGHALAAATFALSIPVVLSSAHLLHRWIEVPFIKWGRSRYRAVPSSAISRASV